MSDKSPLETARENVRDAKEQLPHVRDTQTRHTMYSLVWALEALLEFHELRSVPTE